MHSFFKSSQRREVPDSLSCVQWRAHESHGPSPSSQGEIVTCVYEMMAEGECVCVCVCVSVRETHSRSLSPYVYVHTSSYLTAPKSGKGEHSCIILGLKDQCVESEHVSKNLFELQV